MSGHTPFSELRKDIDASPERLANVEAEKEATVRAGILRTRGLDHFRWVAAESGRSDLIEMIANLVDQNYGCEDFALAFIELGALLREAADLLADALEARWTLKSAAEARALLERLRAVLPQDEPTP